MNILVTGASGFVGSAVWRYFQTQAIPVRPVFRNTDSARLVGVAPEQSAIVPTLAADTDWFATLQRRASGGALCRTRPYLMH